jgi:zinc transport system substrate-binding protein
MLKRLFLVLFLLLIGLSAALAQPRVVSTILPIHSLTASIMNGVAEPELLIPAWSSPHDWNLRPSQRRNLQQADLIIWTSESLESFMPHLLKGIPESVHDLELVSLPDLDLIQDEHPHHGQEEHSIDPHLWLDPQQASLIATSISNTLSQIDPTNARHYQANLDTLRKRLAQLDTEIEQATSSLKGVPFIVYHDAYGYFIRRYDLNQAGEVTLIAHQQPGARHLLALRRQIVDDSIRCLFTEPQFEPAIVQNLIEGTEVVRAELDPIGSALEPGPESYFLLMQTLTANLSACLTRD